MDPYGYVYNNPIHYIDPTGMGPELPPSNFARVIKNYSKSIYNALYYSNNTSNNHFYRWSMGQTGGYGSLKGAVGESIVYDMIKSNSTIVHNILGFDNVFLGNYYGGYQVDVQRFVRTGHYKLGNGYAGSVDLKLPMIVSDFNGGSSIKILGSSKKELYTLNYEVKTLSPNSDVGTIYDYLSTGIDQVNARGGTSKDTTIGVLVTDSASWSKVASDSKYGKLLQSKYSNMTNRGNYLQLVDGLNTNANSKVYELRKEIRNEAKK